MAPDTRDLGLLKKDPLAGLGTAAMQGRPVGCQGIFGVERFLVTSQQLGNLRPVRHRLGGRQGIEPGILRQFSGQQLIERLFDQWLAPLRLEAGDRRDSRK